MEKQHPGLKMKYFSSRGRTVGEKQEETGKVEQALILPASLTLRRSRLIIGLKEPWNDDLA
jgi:hypothetical protein